MSSVQTRPMDFKIDPSLSPNPELPIIWNKYDMLLQEIDVLFQTSNTDILCSGTGWPDIKDYIFKTKVSADTLEQKLSSLIYDKCPSATGVDIDVKVQIMQGSLSDIGVITVTISELDNVVNEKQYYVG